MYLVISKLFKKKVPHLLFFFLLFFFLNGCKEKKTEIECTIDAYKENRVNFTIKEVGNIPTIENVDLELFIANEKANSRLNIKIANDTKFNLILTPQKSYYFDSIFLNNSNFHELPPNSVTNIDLLIPYQQIKEIKRNNSSIYFDLSENKTTKATISMNVTFKKVESILTMQKVVSVVSYAIIFTILMTFIWLFRRILLDTEKTSWIKVAFNYPSFRKKVKDLESLYRETNQNNQNLQDMFNIIKHENSKLKSSNLQLNTSLEEVEISTQKLQALINQLVHEKENQDKLIYSYEIEKKKNSQNFLQLKDTLSLIVGEQIANIYNIEDLIERLKHTLEYKNRGSLLEWKDKIGNGKTEEVLYDMKKAQSIVYGKHADELVILTGRWNRAMNDKNSGIDVKGELLMVDSGLISLLNEILKG